MPARLPVSWAGAPAFSLMLSANPPPPTGAVRDGPISQWIECVATPAWVVDADGRLRGMNAPAESLLGVDREESIDRACCGTVIGRTVGGDDFCSPRCELRRAFAEAGETPPFLLHRLRAQQGQTLLVVPVPAASGGAEANWLVHLAVDVTRAWRSMAFLDSVLRTRIRVPECTTALARLTSRERHVLRLLAQGEEVKRIAWSLGVHRTTVRNHVQHILEKLAVHSMLEAIALHILCTRDESLAAGQRPEKEPESSC